VAALGGPSGLGCGVGIRSPRGETAVGGRDRREKITRYGDLRDRERRTGWCVVNKQSRFATQC